MSVWSWPSDVLALVCGDGWGAWRTPLIDHSDRSMYQAIADPPTREALTAEFGDWTAGRDDDGQFWEFSGDGLGDLVDDDPASDLQTEADDAGA